jgi:hypothetical protein
MTCKLNGILITNGDNDTFPLWALQEAYGIRKDVRIVNLSLLNTEWYIKQLKKLEPRVPISFSEPQIDALTHELNPLTEPLQYTLPNAGITVMLPSRQEQNALRIQDKMVVNIVDSNRWRKPIYFAVTVSNDNFMGLEPYLQMQGLAYEIMPAPVAPDKRIDLDRTAFLLDKVYRFRGLGQRTVPIDETEEKLMSNYAASFIQVALVLRQPLAELKDSITLLEKDVKRSPAMDAVLNTKRTDYDQMRDLAIGKLDQCVSLMPWDWRPRALRQEMLMANDLVDIANTRADEALRIEPNNVEYLKMKAQCLEKLGRTTEANAILMRLAETDPDPWNAYAYLSRNYEEAGQYDSAIAVMDQFLQAHPGDRRAQSTIMRLMNTRQSQAAGFDTAVKEKAGAKTPKG